MANETEPRRPSGIRVPTVGTQEAADLQEEFRKLLYADCDATLDSTRDAGGHIVLNADDFFRRWPPYRQRAERRRWLGPLLYPVARQFTDWAFQQLLARVPQMGNHLVFTAGGGASGKSTILRAQAKRPDVDFIVDTTLSDPERAIRQIDAAMAAGRQVEVNYIYRDFEEAVKGMIERALDPRVGRIVPIDDMARTHFGAQETVYTALERYEEEPRIAVHLWESLPGGEVKRLKLTGLVARQLPAVDELQRRGQRVLDECFQAAHSDPTGQWQGLSGDRAFYEAARSKVAEGISHSRLFAAGGDEEGA